MVATLLDSYGLILCKDSSYLIILVSHAIFLFLFFCYSLNGVNSQFFFTVKYCVSFFFLSCVSELPLAKMKVVTAFRKPAVVMFRAWARSFANVDEFACELRKEYCTTIRFVSHIALSFF